MPLVPRVSPSGPVAPGGGGSQDLEEVLTEGNDGGGLTIENIADPSNPQDAATKAYVDAQVVGSQDLNSVLGVGNSAGAQRITNLLNPAAAQDADTLIARNAAITAAITALPTPSLGDVMNVDPIATIDLGMANFEIYDVSRLTMGGTIDQDGSINSGLLRQKFFGSAHTFDASWYTANNGSGGGIAIQAGHTSCAYEVPGMRVFWPTALPAPGNVMVAAVAGAVVTMSFAAPPAPATPDLDAVLTAGNDAGGLAIENLADPTNAQDAATKAYVDVRDGGRTIYQSLAADHAITAADYTVAGVTYDPAQTRLFFLITTSGVDITLTLQTDASMVPGAVVMVRRVNAGGNTIIVDPDGEQIQFSSFGDSSTGAEAVILGSGGPTHVWGAVYANGWCNIHPAQAGYYSTASFRLGGNEVPTGGVAFNSTTVQDRSALARLGAAAIGSVTLTHLLSEAFTVASPPASPAAGDIAYFSDGDFGQPGFAFYNATTTNWRCLRTNLPVSSSAGGYTNAASAPTTGIPVGATAYFSAGATGPLPCMGSWNGASWVQTGNMAVAII